jgi:hypothetical protein
MADTADLRSEGKHSETPHATWQRQERKKRTAKGLCNVCGVTEVQNRIVCYECSSKKIDGVYLSGLRYHLSVAEIDPDSMLEFLDSRPQYEEIQKLIVLMKLAQYKKKGQKGQFNKLISVVNV